MLPLLAVLALVCSQSEVVRIQAHLETVDAELRAADVTKLSLEQRERRAALIEELVVYRERGMFPRNLELDVRTPFFIDDRGVRCAMAHLIETHGGAALVSRVAATANNAYIRELAGDPELIAWLDYNGLTVAEAGRIQPSYSSGIGERCTASSYCTDALCEQTMDEPELSFCSPSCDPDSPSCPVGVEGIQMQCEARGDHHVCVYPEPSPGTLGWPCDPDVFSDVCIYGCARTDVGGVCTPACSNSRPCPEGYECEPLDDEIIGDYLRQCFPNGTFEPNGANGTNGGCSSATPSALLLGLLFAPLVRRRRGMPTTGR
ncbi:MAG: hypothetical protein AB7O24_21855 [Kofleriaceae bacterium]